MTVRLKRLFVVCLGLATVGALGLGGGPVAASADIGPVPSPASGPSTPPLNVVAVGGDRSADVHWMPPLNDGGGNVSWYAVYAFPQDPAGPIRLTPVPHIMWTGLKPRTWYTFTVTAWNGIGWSAWSNWSNWALTGPVGPPPTPTPTPIPPTPSPTPVPSPTPTPSPTPLPLSCSPHPCAVHVSQQAGAQVDLKVGDSLIVNETDNAFIQWSSRSTDGGVLKLVSETQPPPGTAGAYMAQFVALKAGMVDVVTQSRMVCNTPPCPAFPNELLTFHVSVA